MKQPERHYRMIKRVGADVIQLRFPEMDENYDGQALSPLWDERKKALQSFVGPAKSLPCCRLMVSCCWRQRSKRR